MRRGFVKQCDSCAERSFKPNTFGEFLLHSIDNVIESCSFQCRLLHYGLFIPTFVGTLAVRISLAWPHEVPGFRAKVAGKRRAETYVTLDLPQLRMQQ